MPDIFNNSYKAQEDNKKPKTTTVVKGDVSVKEGKRSFLKEFFAKDIGEIKEYMIFEVLMPKTKDVLFDMIDNAASLIIFGDGRKGKAKASNTYISYNNYSSDKKPSASAIMARRSDILPEIIFKEMSDADDVLNSLIDIIESYNEVSVADYYQAVSNGDTKIDITERDYHWGWKSLGRTEIKRVRDGYILTLPRPISID